MTTLELETANVEVNGTSLAYQQHGSGEPVVFVHGSISDLRMWTPQLEAFGGAGYQAVAYSRRYARPNADIAPGGDDPMATHVEDLEAFLRARELAPAHLVGSSWGATICLTLAAQRPTLVRSLILQEPAAQQLFVHNPPRPADLLWLARNPAAATALIRFLLGRVLPTARLLERGEVERALSRFCTGILGADGEAALSEARRQQMRENISVFRTALTGTYPPVEQAEVRRIQAPTLLITGERSHPAIIAVTKALAALLPNAERVHIPGAAHNAHEDNPTTYNRAVLDFLAAQRSVSLSDGGKV